MNPDDPRLTAYALGELDPAQCAEIEQLLREEPAIAVEIELSRRFADTLRVRLKSERAEPLLAGQRAELLAIATREMPRPAEVASRQVPGWLALAAGVALGIGVALLFPALNSLKVQPATAGTKPPGPRDGSDVRVALIEETALAVEDLVVLNEWPSDGMTPAIFHPPGAMWSVVRMPFSAGDSILHFDTKLPAIEFSAPSVAQSAASVSTATRRNIPRHAPGAKALREARYATAPAPLPAPDWDTRAPATGPLPDGDASFFTRP